MKATDDPGMGALWRRRRDKKARNKSKGQTPGKAKGETCKASTLQRYMCRHERSYKHRGYHDVMSSIDRKGGGAK